MISEYGQLLFGDSSASPEAIPAFYDSEVFHSIEKFLLEKGQICCASYPAGTPHMEKILQKIIPTLGFSNATFRISKTEVANITYSLVFFQCCPKCAV